MSAALETAVTAPAAAPAPPLLEVNNIEVVYNDVILVLRGLSLAVPQGRIVALLGANGAGKSTTFNLVTGVLPVTRGEVLYRGEHISGMPSREIVKRGIGRTFQHVQLLSGMTVLENVALGAHLRGDFAAQGGVLPAWCA